MPRPPWVPLLKSVPWNDDPSLKVTVTMLPVSSRPLTLPASPGPGAGSPSVLVGSTSMENFMVSPGSKSVKLIFSSRKPPLP